jgi:hypothetical protein
VDNDVAPELSRKRLGDQFGGFSGRVVAQLAAAIVAQDPVVETIVRDDVKGGCHGLSRSHNPNG